MDEIPRGIAGEITKLLTPAIHKSEFEEYNKSVMENNKILVIEDDPIVQKSLVEHLVESGFNIVAAGDGAECLQKAGEEKPDLILLDLILPKMDGITFLKKMKDDGAIKDIPVVVLTNLSDKETVAECLASGSTDFLIKTDYTLDEIAEKVRAKLQV